MAWVYELIFRPDGEVHTVFTPEDEYMLPDGTRVRVYSDYVWCHGCRAFTWAEVELPSWESVEEVVRAWEDPDSPACRQARRESKRGEWPLVRRLRRGSEEWIIESRLRDALARRTWLSLRTRPPHCLTCGGTDFVFLPSGQEIPHPGGQGTVQLRCSGHASVVGYIQLYTPDGNPLPPEQMLPRPEEPLPPEDPLWLVYLEWVELILSLPFLIVAALAFGVVWGVVTVWRWIRGNTRQRAVASR